MEPITTETQTSSNKTLYIVLGVVIFVLLALGIFYVVVIRGHGNFAAGVKNILPFGNQAGDQTAVQGGGSGEKLGDIAVPKGSTDLSRMWKIADGPVSGAVFKTLPDGSMTVRYALREDGDIYEYGLLDRSGRILANNTIPRIAEAIWDKTGQTVILRRATDAGDVVSVLGKLIPNTSATTTGDEAPAELKQSFMQENIDFVSPGPKEGFVHTLHEGSNLSLFLLDGGGNITRIFSSPFDEWVPSWPASNTVAIFTRPSAQVGGYLFMIDPKKGSVDPIISDYPGLTANVAPDGDHMLVGGASHGQMTLGFGSRHSAPGLTSPPTLPEKCAWMASSTTAYCGVPQNPARGDYPDTWYQGLVSFSDTIWKMDVVTNLVELAYIPKNEAGVEVDMTNPIISPDNHYLIFTNKRDGSLWGIDLTAPAPTPAS